MAAKPKAKVNAAPMLERLRNDILLGKLKPGTFLRQQNVAQRFEVSRTPAREALTTLEAEGLVENIRHRGHRVREITLGGLLEIIDIRALLEGHAARLAARAVNDELVERLKKIADQIDKTQKCYEETRKGEDLIQWSRKEYEYHQAIIEASGNELLVRLTNGINFQWISFMRESPKVNDDGSIPGHYDIADAIEQGDPDKAEQLARQHLNRYKSVGVEAFFGPVSRID